MRALLLHEPGGTLQLAEVPRPAPGPAEVLVKVHACGLGRTLVWNRQERSSRSTKRGRFPRIIGHEVAGDVVETGAGVVRFGPGDRVAVYYYLTCGACRWCDAGREDLCDNLAGQVGRHIDGGLAEYLVVPARNLCAMPAGLDYVPAAVATDAIATPLHVLRRRARLAPAESVLVIGGGGGVGIHMVAMARALGGQPIAADLGSAKLAAAEAAGADAVIDAADTSIAAAVHELTGGRGVDVVVDLAGTSDTLAAGVDSVGKGGRVVFVGTNQPNAVLPLQPWTLGAGEVFLTGSRYCTREDLQDTLTVVAAGRVQPVVSRTCALGEASEVLDAIENNEIVGRAAVVFAE